MGHVEAVIIGAGVVGIACGLALARRGCEVLILEAEPIFGTGISSRNSEVIHAGLYYEPGSLKARLCVEGRDLLYAFCGERAVPHRRIGKIIFALDHQESGALDRIAARAEAAGVRDLRWLSGKDVAALEPALACTAALHSPSTGIIDAHSFMLAMLGEIEARGGRLICNTTVTDVSRGGPGWSISVDDEAEPAVEARLLVNAAGLGAQAMASKIEGLAAQSVPPLLLSRGCYFGYAGTVPFSRLIYPVPVPGGLGTHLTLDLAGRARFGPNVEAIEHVDYTVEAASHAEFAAAAKRIWPALDPSRLYPDYAGIRPKIAVSPGKSADFVLAGPDTHGLPDLVNLFGIESPGLTAALAVGEEVARLLDGNKGH